MTNPVPTTTSASIAISSSFKPAPIANQASDYTLTIKNNATASITVTNVMIDVGQGNLAATYALAGVSTPPLSTQDFLTYQITWSGKLIIAAGKSGKITFPGGFTGIPCIIKLPSISITSTLSSTPTTFSGPKVTIK
jgi:hypothetical protein